MARSYFVFLQLIIRVILPLSLGGLPAFGQADLDAIKSKLLSELQEIQYQNDTTDQEKSLAFYLLAELTKERSPRVAWQYLGMAESLAPQDRVQMLPSILLMKADIQSSWHSFSRATNLYENLLSQRGLGRSMSQHAINGLFLNLVRSKNWSKLGYILKAWPYDDLDFASLDEDTLVALLDSGSFDFGEDRFSFLEALAGQYFYSPRGMAAFSELLSYSDRTGKDYVPSMMFLNRMASYGQLENGILNWLTRSLNRTIKIGKSPKILSGVEKLEALIKWRFYEQAETFFIEMKLGSLSIADQKTVLDKAYHMYMRFNEFEKAGQLSLKLARMGIDQRYRLASMAQNQGDYQLAFKKYRDLAQSRNRTFYSMKALLALIAGQDYEGAIRLFHECDRLGRFYCWSPSEYSGALFWLGRSLEKKALIADALKVYQRVLDADPESYYAALIQNMHRSQIESLIVPFENSKNIVRLSYLSNDTTFSDVPAFSAEANPKLSGRKNLMSQLHQVEVLSRVKPFLRDMTYRDLDRQNLLRWSLLSQKFGSYRTSKRAFERSGGGYTPFRNFNGFVASLQRDASFWQVNYPRPFAQIVAKSSEQNELDPHLVYSVMRAESAYDPLARSSVGARGVLQLMPYTALKIAKEFGFDDFKFENLKSPYYNIPLATLYLRKLIDYYEGNIPVALAAYNAGPQAIQSWLERCKGCDVLAFIELIPFKETRGYVKRIIKFYGNYSLIYNQSMQNLVSSLPQVRQRNGLY